MAQAVVSVVKNLGELLVEEALLLSGVHDQVSWLESELRAMLCFLRDADCKRRGHDERVKNWVREIRDVAYKAEDVVENFLLEIERRRWPREGLVGIVVRYALIPSELIVRHRVASDIGKIKTTIIDIADRRARYGITNIIEPGGGGRSYADERIEARRRILPDIGDDEDIVGFNDDVRAILSQLLDRTKRRRTVIPIVGMGGLGKTTLAKKIYNTYEIKREFICIWVTVSRVYKKDVLVRSIRSKLSNERREVEDVKKHRRSCLRDGRYLIVLDDVWDTDVWRTIEQAIPDKNNCSRVLITTRSIEVARSADSSTSPYELHFLNDADSWELFLRKAFTDRNGKRSCPEELGDLGRQLVKRCGGLPLALVVLGGLLSKKEKDPLVWLNLKNRLKWETTEDGRQCLEILALSYDDLPYDLKPCFIYLGCFPEDSEVSATKLIRLWTAEGFIPQQRDGETLEETAADFLEELIQRCMVQVVERRSDHGVKKFRVHDLLRDLCIAESREDQSLQVCSNQDHEELSGDSRRVALLHFGTKMFQSLNNSSPSLRSLLCFNVYASVQTVNLIIYRLKLLRVMDLEGVRVSKLPKEISSMIHLRYLGLRDTWLREVPSSIAHLYHLQTLDVRGTFVGELPSAFWKIPTLRHVCFSWASVLLRRTGVPKNLQTLKGVCNLQTLKGVRTGSWIGKHLPELTNLRNLELHLPSDSNAQTLCNTLEKLNHLASLRLLATPIPVEAVPVVSKHQLLHVLSLMGRLSRQMLPDSHQFPPNLTKLTLRNSELEHDPMPVLEKLPNLRVLRLRVGAYKGKEMVCTAGGFRRLQDLQLNMMRELENWRVEEGAMCNLVKLLVEDCKALKMLPEGLRHIGTLQELVLVGMPAEFNHCRAVKHVPSIIHRGYGGALNYLQASSGRPQYSTGIMGPPPLSHLPLAHRPLPTGRRPSAATPPPPAAELPPHRPSSPPPVVRPPPAAAPLPSLPPAAAPSTGQS